MPLPDIDPIIIHIAGPFAISWYSLAYVAGILLGWIYCNMLIKAYPSSEITRTDISDLITWLVFGIVLGGRLGYVIIYNPAYYIENPGEIFKTYMGGMSFHGAIIGVALSCYLFARYQSRKTGRDIRFLRITDLVCASAPLGIMLGRIANFINGELYGKVADPNLPWAFVFPKSGNMQPRHPSQLYEAFFEGFLIFAAMLFVIIKRRVLRTRGFITGFFLVAYSFARFAIENWREPDAHIGFLFGWLSMGQLLSLIFILFGMLFLIMHTEYRPEEYERIRNQTRRPDVQS